MCRNWVWSLPVSNRLRLNIIFIDFILSYTCTCSMSKIKISLSVPILADKEYCQEYFYWKNKKYYDVKIFLILPLIFRSPCLLFCFVFFLLFFFNLNTVCYHMSFRLSSASRMIYILVQCTFFFSFIYNHASNHLR